MRLIAGRFRKVKLFTDNSNTTRPTTDYVREVIFSVLFGCEDAIVLDLFAGSGSLGLEALSRGAKHVTFVDASIKAIKILKKNIEKTKTSDECDIVKKEVSRYIGTTDKKFDLIFMDPPYNKKLVNKTIAKVLELELLSQNGRIVIEHSPLEKIASEFESIVTYSKSFGASQVTMMEQRNE